MSKIRAKDTKPELIVRRFLFNKGLRYRLHQKDLPGKPDMVLKKFKTVIFINGCFWHGHKSCKKSQLPQTNNIFWASKIGGNKLNDKKNQRRLKKLGWNVIVIWECELKVANRQKYLLTLVDKIVSQIF